jgi:hypothetical protein
VACLLKEKNFKLKLCRVINFPWLLLIILTAFQLFGSLFDYVVRYLDSNWSFILSTTCALGLG